MNHICPACGLSSDGLQAAINRKLNRTRRRLKPRGISAENQARIRREYAEDDRASCRSLARKYDSDAATINHILRGM